MELSPVISAKYIDMSSKLRPLVSGNRKYMKAKMTTQIPASIKKNPLQPMALAVERNVEDIKVAQIRLKNVATLIDLARILVAKISDGINHAPGPIPILKKERYNDSPTIANTGPVSLPPKKEKLVKIRAPHIPDQSMKHERHRW